jgi:hypothetical protein
MSDVATIVFSRMLESVGQVAGYLRVPAWAVRWWNAGSTLVMTLGTAFHLSAFNLRLPVVQMETAL